MSEKEQASLLEALEKYRVSGLLPMHMPGHKRNTSLAPYLAALGAGWDITEIAGFDDLHDAEGILQEAMNRASEVWKSGRTWFLVGGSTCGLLAGIRAALSAPRSEAIVFRNCHKAVYHALELTDVAVTFLSPENVPGYSFAGSASPRALAEALEQHPAAKLVVLTSPTYEGVVSDIREICRVAHEKGAAVLVDEAHGAHLGFDPAFPAGAVSCDADLVIQSVHKTLPSLTQTALLHRNGNRIADGELERQLGVFETSSPSYLLMSSIDGCAQLMGEKGGDLCHAWAEALSAFDCKIAELKKLRVFNHGAERGRLPGGVFAVDPSKIVIETGSVGMSGVELARILRESYQIELEMEAGDYAIAMTGMGDTEKSLTQLADALMGVDRELQSAPCREKLRIPSLSALPERALPLSGALRHETENVPAAEAAGRISGAYLWAYPPGIPLLIPGETVSQAFLAYLAAAENAGVKLKSLPQREKDCLLCLTMEWFSSKAAKDFL